MFRIYYEDGSHYEGDPYLAPACGVQVIVTENKIAKQKEGWYWKDGLWHACDTAGMFDYLMNHPGPLKVLFGRSLRDKDYNRIMVEAEAYWNTVR